MKKILTLLLICLLPSFASCRANSLGATGYHSAFAISTADIPYTYNGEIKFDYFYKLDEDEYGRVLYLHDQTSQLFNPEHNYHDLYRYIVCQKEDEQYAYYYEDYCYIVSMEKLEPTDEKIEKLKERNDWGLLPDKKAELRAANIDEMYKDIGTPDVIRDRLRVFLNLNEDYAIGYCGMEYNENGDQLMFVTVSREETTEDGKKEFISREGSYLLIYPIDPLTNTAYFEEFEPTLDCQDIIHDFKARCFYGNTGDS